MRNSPNLVANTQTLSLQDRATPEKVDEEDEEDLEDDDFMHSWRQSRLKEMQNGPRESYMHRNVFQVFPVVWEPRRGQRRGIKHASSRLG